MAIYSEHFNYNRNVLRYLHKRHADDGLTSDDLEEFSAELIDAVEPDLVFLFKILPKFPRMQAGFYKKRTPEEFEVIAALANLAGIRQKDLPMRPSPFAMPDIKLTSDAEDDHEIGVFDPQAMPYYSCTEDALSYFWNNFTVDEISQMNEEDQLILLAYIQQADFDMLDNQTQHMRLVFGLHIPQELKSFHEEACKELAARIMVNDDFYTILAAFTDQEKVEKLGHRYMTDEEDKRFFVNFFMRQLAEIWQIPQPIEEDFNAAPQPDKTGKDFYPLMHAFYRAANDNQNNKPMGLIFGSNTHKNGYMPGDRFETIRSLGHEFAHLVSNFIVSAQHNGALIEAQAKKQNIQAACVLTMGEMATILKANNVYSVCGKYYAGDTTDFDNLEAPDGLHVYAGQLEERHANWLMKKIGEAVSFAMSAPKLDQVTPSMAQEAMRGSMLDIMDGVDMQRAHPFIYNESLAAIDRANNFKSLETCFMRFCTEMNIMFGKIDLTSHSASARRAREAKERLKEFSVNYALLFDVRPIVLEYKAQDAEDYGLEQNALMPD